ncbi:GAF domain-containing protein [Liquorilactobacillus oeni]|uniref:Protein YtsP n=1 Tax=Liquorilactobacillus oeni DSM 19972 TaxID=1423777 RepID=A0A0R1M7R5_9LACO|nr:GAF domain-containing protein [Liquorilactobacillus oeni]KRL04191.1 protein YtsP [Liquorilactobacillus oeni DSM 19972]
MKEDLLNRQLETLLANETNLIANLANASALLYHSLPEINWAGFYLYDEGKDELVLGPFQGNVACVRIQMGKGVCGNSFLEQKTLLIKDVSTFKGHIACDAASRSEIVIPLSKKGSRIGVLDIDSPKTARFKEEDRCRLERFAEILLKSC